LADRIAIGRDRSVEVREQVAHLQAVRLAHRALEERRGHAEADEALVGVRQKRTADRVHDVERELDDDVLARCLSVGHHVAVLLLEFWIHDRHRDVDRFRMTARVVGVVGERAERKRKLVDVTRIAQQRFDEIAGADVVHQVAEELVAERVVTEILNHRAAVRERARTYEILRRCARETLLEQWFEKFVPGDVDRRFVGEDRIGR